MVLAAFLSGSIMYSYGLPKILLKKDIREGTGDENPGGYNVYRVHKKLGLSCILLDMLKGFLPVYLFVKKCGMHTPWIIPIMLAPVLGHAFTPFFKGKGGKALSTAAGSMLGFLPVSSMGILLMGLAFFFSVIAVINPFEIRVLVVMVVFSMLLMLFGLGTIWTQVGSWGLTGILWYKQREKMLVGHRPITCTFIWSKEAAKKLEQIN